MVVFKILTLLAVTTTVFGKPTTTTEQPQRLNPDMDVINVTCKMYGNEECFVNFGLFGARKVIISYENYYTNEGEIILHVGYGRHPRPMYSGEAKIDVSSAIQVDKGKTMVYEVTEMVDIGPGSMKVSEMVLNRNIRILSISFIPKKLVSENPYRIISTSNKLGITIKSWDRNKDETTPMLYDSICENRQSFHFEQNEMGEYRIIYKIINENYLRYLQVRDATRKIGDEVILDGNPGSEDNVWSILRGENGFKIQSKLTGTCISAIHGVGSNLVLVDCKNGRVNEWSLKFCDG